VSGGTMANANAVAKSAAVFMARELSATSHAIARPGSTGFGPRGEVAGGRAENRFPVRSCLG
jgi:hypothetical protein